MLGSEVIAVADKPSYRGLEAGAGWQRRPVQAEPHRSPAQAGRNRAVATLQLASLWVPVVVAMALVYYGSSRPDGARPLVRPLRTAIVRMVEGLPHART